MKIGEVIRKYRKEKQLTQEEMAHCLGVTAPAVNKWENGVSLPDVSLLAPIARLLGISTDTLLSYKEELTDSEINQIVLYAVEKMKKDGYDSMFMWAEEKLHEYPECEKLILNMAQLLDSYRIISAIECSKKYEDKIWQLYDRLLKSQDSDIVQSAASALFYSSISREDYDKAEMYLNKIPNRNFTVKRLWALLRQRQGKKEEAYRLYEEILMAGYNDITTAMYGIYAMALDENDIDKAAYISEKVTGAAVLFEMGKYMEVVPKLGIAVHLKDKEETLRILAEVIEYVKDMDALKKSRLYTHLNFKEPDIQNVLHMLEKGFKADETMDFVRDDVRYAKMMKDLSEMMENKI